jgi:hypothetical protein
MRTLADLTVDYHGLMLLTYYTVYLLGLSERPSSSSTTTSSLPPSVVAPPPLTPPRALVTPLLRALSSLHKSYICHHAIPLVYACMEALGGVGYLLNSESEHINVARLFRDACVGAIWEGTTDVLAGDTLRAMKKKHSSRGGGGDTLEAVGWFVKAGLQFVKTEKRMGAVNANGGGGGGEGKEEEEEEMEEAVGREWEKLRKRVEQATQEELLPQARGIVFRLAEVLIAVLYMVDAAVHPGAEIEEMCRRHLVKKRFMGEQEGRGQKDLAMDQAIVYGAGKAPVEAGSPGSKL